MHNSWDPEIQRCKEKRKIKNGTKKGSYLKLLKEGGKSYLVEWPYVEEVFGVHVTPSYVFILST